MTIRPERPRDIPAIRRLLLAAFPTAAEADLVDRLRDRGEACHATVAEDDGRVVGHLVFSPVSVAPGGATGLGLAPLTVEAACRRRGIGARLVEAGLAASGEAGVSFVVVLGEPGYYGRLGFRAASEVGIGNAYGVDAPFMIRELRPGGLPGGGGLATFGPAFDGLG